MGLGVLILLVGLAGTGLIFQVVVTRNDQQEFPAPGELVDIGGYQLHIHCFGEGSPTIILDALGSGSSASWGLVQPETTQSTRVCSYDRAGAGWSDRGPTPRDVNQQVHELHALLARARVDGPYVLVGHSYGGRIARVYAKAYPREVVGMVLVDPGTLGDDPRFPRQYHKELAAECRRHVKTDCESESTGFATRRPRLVPAAKDVTQKLIGPADGALNGTCPSLLPTPDPAVVLA